MVSGTTSLGMVVGLLSAILVPPPAVKAQVTAFTTNCDLAGPQTTGEVQFLPTCPGRAPSPDRHHAVVQTVIGDGRTLLELQDASGRVLDALPSLSDGMPLTVRWAPNAKWFLANHYDGSGLSFLQLFEMVGNKAIERPALGGLAIKEMVDRYPCLQPDLVMLSGLGWSQDSASIILLARSRLDACSAMHLPGAPTENGHSPDAGWKPLRMIGKVAHAAIDPKSIRSFEIDDPRAFSAGDVGVER